MQLLALPETVPAGIEVWLLTLNLQAPLYDADLSILSDSERNHAASLRFHEDRVRSVTARAALRRLLAPRVSAAPETLVFTANEYGKLCLKKHAHIEFNVSHAGGFALIALSVRQRVGVDIEHTDRPIDVHSLLRHVLSPLEHQSVPMTQQTFMQHWVAKESALKALGYGITEHLQAVSIIAGDSKDYQIICDYPSWPKLKGWRLDLPTDGYLAALTVEC